MTEPGDLAAALRSGHEALREIAPLLRRATGLDPATVARITLGDRTAALVRLPFGVLAGRAINTAGGGLGPLDATYRAAELQAWLDDETSEPPQPRDHEWRGTVPPALGWQRIELVPDTVVRDLVRTGALTLKDAAAREGVPGAQPRAEVADALLDSVVLTVTDGPRSAQVTLRLLSALTRLGFLPRGSYIAVDVAGRWLRVAAEYGSVYSERPGGLGALSPR